MVMPRVIKRDASREPFDEAKLRGGIVRALEKRPVNSEAVESSVERIIHELQTAGEREIPSREVGEMVMVALQALDQVAFVRFASVYRSFQDLSEFRDAIERLEAEPAEKD